MPSELAHIETWLIEEWTARLAAAIESMTGERPAVSASALADPPQLAPAAPGDFSWRQPFPPLPGAVWIVAPPGCAEASGSHVMRALGVEDSSAEEQKSTFLEILNQALAGLAQALTGRLKREVNHVGGGESRPVTAYPPSSWAAVSVPLGDQPVALQVAFETALPEAIRAAEVQAAAVPEPPAGASGPPAPAPRSPVDNSKTFALLLEVELPVAVSFGRAHIPLKDVLKLTTGSIVELNRAVSEPVDVIVNNCVIARGEVVVVEGNYGIRIRQVISRQERLRTLY